MKKEIIYFTNINKSFTFYIGENEYEQFEMMDIAKPNDIWFHVENGSSCHVILSLDENINLSKKEKHTILKRGALLCKMNTNRIKSSTEKKTFIYTTVENVKKTSIPGRVITENIKNILI
jgi:predicted ribosome quality control (RQC) complex YloA/Tae2 family protein